MTNKRIFVFDTNVIISAVLLPNSKPALALKKAQSLGKVLMSSETWSELERVIKRPKFNRYIGLEAFLFGKRSDYIEVVMSLNKKTQGDWA